MAALFFPHLDTLRFVLASGMIADEIVRGPARAGFDAQGRLWLEPMLALSREELSSLARVGVQALAAGDLPTESVQGWAALLPLHAKSSPLPTDDTQTILFELPDHAVPGFCRLLAAHDRPNFRIALLPGEKPGRAWVACRSVPGIVLLRCSEETGEAEAFCEQAPGVWVKAGWEHPLPEFLARPSGVILVRPPRSIAVHAGDVPHAEPDEFALLHQAVRPPVAAEVRPCPIGFTLRRIVETEREVVWTFRGTEVETFWNFCRRADERLLRQFEVAAARHEGEVLVVVRPMPGKIVPPYLPLPSAGFCPDPRVPGLFRPSGWTLHPPVRAIDLTRTLGLRAEAMTWIGRTAEGVAACSIPTSAFHSAATLIEYQVPPVAHLTAQGSRAGSFPLEGFAPIPTEEDSPFADGAPASIAHEDHSLAPAGSRPGWLRRSIEKLTGRFRWPEGVVPEPLPALPVEPKSSSISKSRPPLSQPAADRVHVKLSSADALVHGVDHTARRQELESRLLSEFPVIGPEGRARGWADLAAVYVATGNSADAAICWLNAIWESDPRPTEWLEQWLVAEGRVARLPAGPLMLAPLLNEPRSSAIVRVVAAYTVWGSLQSPAPPDLHPNLSRIVALLNSHFDDLPVRAVWLARRAISRLSDGDVLGLARWRDRILARLRDKGPGLDVDEPSFLRFHGTSSPHRFQTARDWLARSRRPILEWIARLKTPGRLRREGLDPETAHTSQYATLMLSWGLGCLGERTRSRDWAARARKALGRSDAPEVDRAVHGLLADLFLHRIRDCQEGRPSRPELPADLRDRLERLPETNLARYSVDKLRRHSRILEPIAVFREYRGLDMREFRGFDRLGERLHLLADRPDTAALNDEARSLLDLCDQDPTSGTVPRVAVTLLDLAPHLDGPIVASLLSRVVPALAWLESWLQSARWTDAERAERLPRYLAHLLGGAFTAATLFNDWPSVRSILEHLLSRAESDAALRTALTLTSSPLFRVFRKLGYRSEAEALMAILDPARGEWPPKAPLSPSQVGLAVGWFAAGDDEAGDAILNEAQRRLFVTREGTDPERTELAIAYAEALGFAPPRIALGRLEQIFQSFDRVHTVGSTNLYFTLKPLQLIDAVVRSVVTEDFSLGPAVRGWMDDDEFLIRRRIHRDMAEVLRAAGIG